MTKEDVLQKANEYCSEKGYTSETLTDEFKDKFADFFAKKNPDADIEDESILSDMQFNLNTAFSATSKGVTLKQKALDAMKADYEKQIEELNKKIAKKKDDKKEIEIPDDLKKKLEELEMYKNAQSKQEKYKSILELAKKSVREDLHKSFENYSKDFSVNLDESDEVQAKKLTARFQEIFRDSIGDIKPLSPRQIQKNDEDILATIQKVKV